MNTKVWSILFSLVIGFGVGAWTIWLLDYEERADEQEEGIIRIVERSYYDTSEGPMQEWDAPLLEAQLKRDGDTVTIELVSSIPDVCHTFGGLHIHREGRFFLVDVKNQRPVDLAGADCLDTDEQVSGQIVVEGLPSKEYLLVVNSEEINPSFIPDWERR